MVLSIINIGDELAVTVFHDVDVSIPVPLDAFPLWAMPCPCSRALLDEGRRAPTPSRRNFDQLGPRLSLPTQLDGDCRHLLGACPLGLTKR